MKNFRLALAALLLCLLLPWLLFDPILRTLTGLVQVEGPHSRFNFDSTLARQVWVGQGIDITPFIARLQQLAASEAERTSSVTEQHPKTRPI